jgi:hypothetical protein
MFNRPRSAQLFTQIGLLVRLWRALGINNESEIVVSTRILPAKHAAAAAHGRRA